MIGYEIPPCRKLSRSNIFYLFCVRTETRHLDKLFGDIQSEISLEIQRT